MRFNLKTFDVSGLRRLLTITHVMFLLLLVFLVWASFFELDQAVRAQGKLIPADHTQIIQAADGGVLSRVLVQEGDTSQLEVMRAQRQVTELQGRSNAVRNKYLQDARAEAAKIAEDLATNYYRLEERQSVLDHTTITAPVAGVVKYQRVTTIGGVLRQCDELMQISPMNMRKTLSCL